MTGMPESETPKMNAFRLGLRWFVVLLYLIAGIFHLALPGPFLTITPTWVPFPQRVIFLTGLCELAGALGLLLPSLRKAAGLALALYAIAVFPANINHAMLDMGLSHPVLGWWYHILRFALQPLIVWAALFASAWINWPFPRNQGAVTR